MLILLAWTFGGLGVPAFVLGWWGVASSILVLMLFTCFACAFSSDSNSDDYREMTVDANRKVAIRCCSVCTGLIWAVLTLVANVAVCLPTLCVDSNGVQCKLV